MSFFKVTARLAFGSITTGWVNQFCPNTLGWIRLASRNERAFLSTSESQFSILRMVLYLKLMFMCEVRRNLVWHCGHSFPKSSSSNYYYIYISFLYSSHGTEAEWTLEDVINLFIVSVGVFSRKSKWIIYYNYIIYDLFFTRVTKIYITLYF